MRINRIVYDRYCQHTKRNDVLGSGVIGVLGSNGSGKSNWLKGMLRAVTGKTFNAGKNEDDVSWGEKSGSVEVFFSVRGTPGRVKRDLKTSRCSMEFGDQKFKAAKEIDAAIFNVLGVSPKLLQEVVFVQQGQIEQILFQRPAERAKALQALFGTEHAEKIRAVLQDELTRCVISSRADVIKELRGQLNSLSEDLKRTALARNDHIANVLSPEKASELGTLVQSLASYAEAKERVDKARIELENYRGQHNDANGLVSMKTEALKKLESAVAESRNDVSKARQAVVNYDATKTTVEQQQRRVARIKELVYRIAAEEPPEDPDKADFSELDSKKKDYEPRKQRLEQWRNFLRSFENTAATLTCPTCLQPVSPEYAGQIDTAVKEEEPKLDELDRDIQFQEAERKHMADAFDRWRQSYATATAELATLQNQAAEAPVVTLPSDEQVAEMRSLIESFENSERTIIALKQEIAVQQERAKNMWRAVTNTSIEVDKLTSRLAKEPDAAKIASAQSKLSNHEEARIKAAQLDGELKQLEERFEQVKTMLAQREAEEAKLDGLKTYRGLCERARTILHRDNLPNMVAQAYMKSLNAHLAHYLEIFEVPYRAYMREDTSVICKFNGQEVPAERLSGGQRVALGLTWRFAVHNLFVNHLGLMILDEPTVFLDKDRIDSVYQLLEKVKSYSQAAGLQLIVVTHEERLSGAFDQVIQL